MHNIINQIKNLINVSVRFDFPEPKKILKYNEGGINLLKRTIKRDFNIMPTFKKKIYFWIFIRQIIFFDFSFSTYFKNYVKFTSAKIVINLLDNNLFCYKIKDALSDISFITIQNGHRDLKTKMFQKTSSKLLKI
jgi:surface carbohydrate biosynthesis protein